MNRHTFTSLTAIALALTASLFVPLNAPANASFVSWGHEIIQLASGRVAMNVYAVMSDEGDRIFNVGPTNITTNAAGGFYQSAANPFWAPGSQNPATADDSFVCLDVNPNTGLTSASATLPDPNFRNFTDELGSTDFSRIISVTNSSGAGWYAPNPNGIYGLANGYRVLVAHFVAGNGAVPPTGYVSWRAGCVGRSASTGMVEVVYANEEPLLFHWDGSDAPAPGALVALLARPMFRQRRRQQA